METPMTLQEQTTAPLPVVKVGPPTRVLLFVPAESLVFPSNFQWEIKPDVGAAAWALGENITVNTKNRARKKIAKCFLFIYIFYLGFRGGKKNDVHREKFYAKTSLCL